MRAPLELSVPTRPAGVPAEAAWDFAEQAWVVQSRDAHGELHGALHVYGRGGVLQARLEYRNGKRHGRFERFHPSGRVAQVGRYFDDHLDGLTIRWSAGDESDSIRTCCIPAATRVLKQEHRYGALLSEAFFTADGRQLLEGEASPSEEPREREDDVLLRDYGFWPALEPLPAGVEAEEALVVAQPLPELKSAIRRAARRVQECRARLLAAAPALAPPDVSSLLTEPVELRCLEVRLPESEAPVLILEELWLPTLTPSELAWRARVEWTALCWLCWAAGASALELPERLRPQPELHAALVHASERVRSLEAFAPAGPGGAHFHGLNEAMLPASALSRLAEHYREVRAVLLFALDPECVSAWQSDLGRRPEPGTSLVAPLASA